MSYPSWMHKRIIGTKCRYCGNKLTEGSIHGMWIVIGDAGSPRITVASRCTNRGCMEFHALPMPPDRFDLVQAIGEMYRRSEHLLPGQYIHRDEPTPRRMAVEPMLPSISSPPLSPIEDWEIERLRHHLAALAHKAGSPEVRAFIDRLGHRPGNSLT